MRTGLLLAWFWGRFYRFALIGHVHNVHDRESVMMTLADRVIAVSQSVAATMAGSGIAKSKIRVVLNRTIGSRRQPAMTEIEPAALQTLDRDRRWNESPQGHRGADCRV